MLLICAIGVLLLLLWLGRNNREGMSASCSPLSDEQVMSDNPIPFCSNGPILKNSTKCSPMKAGKCKRPYKYGLCPGILEFEGGECVMPE